MGRRERIHDNITGGWTSRRAAAAAAYLLGILAAAGIAAGTLYMVLAADYGFLRSTKPEAIQFGRFIVAADTVSLLNRACVPFLLLSCALALVSFAILLAGAGRRFGEEGLFLSWKDRVPLALQALVYALAGCALLSVLATLVPSMWNEPGFSPALWAEGAGTAVTCALGMLLILSWCRSLAARVKSGRFFHYTLTGWCWRVLRRTGRAAAENLPLMGKGIAAMLGLFLLQGFMMLLLVNEPGTLFFLFLVWKAAESVLVLWVLLQADRIAKGGARLAQGNYLVPIAQDHMLPSLRMHAENINAAAEGLSVAVEKRLRSERQRTELITNVSHDIKTPLTSIINYVELLEERLGPEQEEAVQEYLEVIGRQSVRLKRLLEDLIEASRASTGSIEMDIAPCSLQLVLAQSLGEFEDRLQGSGLSIVQTLPEEAVLVLADARYLWRVLENLLSNICKYAMPGTRVYIDIAGPSARGRGTASLSLKNVSASQLNISPEELTERFVRGDASRHTEGSGLGLSIARSLMENMGGKLAVEIDGDLFKASVCLPCADCG